MHATHEEFEGALEQLQAHWLVWLGLLLTFAVAALALAASTGPIRGYALALGGCLLYGGVALWHFVEHANGRDPSVAHILLVMLQIAVFAGVAVATVEALRARHHDPDPEQWPPG